MNEYTIHPLVVGLNRTDQGIMTYQRGYGQRIWLPIMAFLIKGGEGNILVDSGMEDFMLPEDADHGLEVLEFEEALERHGLTPEDIDLLIQTHLHNDHCENTYKCTNARVVVQQIELDFCLNPHPLDHRYFADLIEDLELETVEGDVEIAPGIELLLTPGHTPGGQSVAVNTSAGRAIITGFCCNDKNFPSTGPAVPPGVHTDAIVAYDSINRIKDLADILIPAHDLAVARKTVIP